MNRFIASLFLPLFACAMVQANDADKAAAQDLAKRQCRSVHVSHSPMPQGCQAIYMEVTAEKSAPGTYFSACNFDDGYIGMQDLGRGRKVAIFSIWDPVAHGDNPNDVPEGDRTELIKVGEGFDASRFGYEGTGGKSMGAFDWQLNKPVKFLVTVSPSKVKEGYKVITGYVCQDSKWRLISSWRTTRSAKELSRATSFVEDFRRNYESAKQQRSAVYGPCFVLDKEGKWQLMTSGVFTADPTPSENICAELVPSKHAFRIATGGDTKMGEWKLWKEASLPEVKRATPPSPGKDVEKLVKTPIEEPDAKPAADKKETKA